MAITNNMTDNAILAEMGRRLAQWRINLQLTQARLADEAGVSKRTVERIEAGTSAQMSSMIRVLRVLDLVEGLDRLAPENGPRPMDLLKLKGKTRQRASSKRRSPPPGDDWSWGDGE